MPLLGIANGLLREVVLMQFLSNNIAHRVSVFTLIIFLFAYGLMIKNKIAIHTRSEALLCGVIWLMLTLGFEFGFGHFVFQVSYEKLLADYNVAEGKLWPLVLIFTASLPFMLRKLNSQSS